MDSISSPLNPKKRLKEEFVSNLTGSSMLEISALATLVPVLILLRHSVGSDHIVGTATAETKLKKNDNALLGSKSWWDFLTALLVDFFLVVLPILLFLTVLAEWLYQWVALMTLLLLFCVVSKRPSSCSPSVNGRPLSLRTNISSYRVSMMDIGVGSFVVANALVSCQARNISSKKMKTAIQSTSPLIILGFARLLSTTGVDYQVTKAA